MFEFEFAFASPHIRLFLLYTSRFHWFDSLFLCGAWQKSMYIINKKAHTVRTRRQTRRDVMSNWKRKTWRKKSVDDLLWRDRKDIVCYLAFRMIDISEQRRTRLFNLLCCCACVLCAHPAFPYVNWLLCSALSDAKQRRTRAKTQREEGAYFFFFIFSFDFINMLREAHEIPWRSRNGKAADSLWKFNVKEMSNCGKRVNIVFFYLLILWINYAWIHASASVCVRCVHLHSASASPSAFLIWIFQAKLKDYVGNCHHPYHRDRSTFYFCSVCITYFVAILCAVRASVYFNRSKWDQTSDETHW